MKPDSTATYILSHHTRSEALAYLLPRLLRCRSWREVKAGLALIWAVL